MLKFKNLFVGCTFVILTLPLLAEGQKEYTFSLSVNTVNSKYTKAQQESHSNGYTSIASLSKKVSKKIILTGILGYVKTNLLYDSSGSDAKSDIDVNLYGLSSLVILTPSQYLNASVIYNTSRIGTDGTINNTNVGSTTDATSLTATLSFIQIVPVNQRFYTSFTGSLNYQDGKTLGYTTSSGSFIPASTSTVTYATFRLEPNYIMGNGWKANVNIQYSIANRSFVSGEEDRDYYMLGFMINKQLGDTWEIGLYGNRQYRLIYSQSDSIGLSANIKF